MYLSQSSFLANLTPPNKQFFQVKLEFKSLNHVSYSYAIKKFILLGGVKVAFLS